MVEKDNLEADLKKEEDIQTLDDITTTITAVTIEYLLTIILL